MNYVLPLDYLSPSQVLAYMRCPACYELQYIDKRPHPMSIELPIGGGVHRAIELMRIDLSTGRELEQIESYIEAGSEHYCRQLAVDKETDSEVILDLGNYSHEDQGKDEVARLASFAVVNLIKADSERKIIAAEVGICSNAEYLRPDTQFSVPADAVENAWPFATKAFADGLYGNPNGITLLSDVKTSKRKSFPDAYTGLQAAWYLRPFHLSGQDFPVVIDQIVKNDHPQYHAYVAMVSQRQHSLIYDQVVKVAEQISAGNFPARPGYWCRFDHGFPGFKLAVER